MVPATLFLPPGQDRPPHTDVFRAQYTTRLSLCECFVPPVARQDASREAKATGWSYLSTTLSFVAFLQLDADAFQPL